MDGAGAGGVIGRAGSSAYYVPASDSRDHLAAVEPVGVSWALCRLRRVRRGRGHLASHGGLASRRTAGCLIAGVAIKIQ